MGGGKIGKENISSHQSYFFPQVPADIIRAADQLRQEKQCLQQSWLSASIKTTKLAQINPWDDTIPSKLCQEGDVDSKMFHLIGF